MARKGKAKSAVAVDNRPAASGSLSEFWTKEDWWAVWLGLGIVIAAIIAYLSGGTIKPIAVKPASWESFDTLKNHFAEQWPWYLAQFALWAAAFGVSTSAMGFKPAEFLPAFAFVYVLSLIIF